MNFKNILLPLTPVLVLTVTTELVLLTVYDVFVKEPDWKFALVIIITSSPTASSSVPLLNVIWSTATEAEPKLKATL